MSDSKQAKQPRPEVAKPWFNIKPRAEASRSADVYIYDVIGGWFGLDVEQFVTGIAALDVDQINLYVNSPGGLVYDAIAVTNALRRHPAHVVATVDGLAASAASFVITSADEVVMGQNSELMIHDAWSVAIGNAQDMRDAGDDLDRLSQNIASMYAKRAGGTADEWRQIMLDETWYSADEAVTAGIADRVDGDESTGAENLFDLSRFAFSGRSHAPEPPLERIAAMTRPRVYASARAEDPRTETPELPGSPASEKQPTTKGNTMAEKTETEAPESQKVDENAIDAILAAKVDKKLDDILAAFQAGPSASPSALDMLAHGEKSAQMPYSSAMSLFAAKANGLAPAEDLSRLKATITDGNSVFAALSNVGFGDATLGGITNTNPPQWIGELVDKVPYASLWDLVAHADLTSPNVTGFQMVTKPTGGTKGDAGAAVTSTGAKWSPVTVAASRWAGADSFDRMAFDFGISSSALDGYFRAQLYNYFVARDVGLLTAMKAGLTAAEAVAPPTGSSIALDTTNVILDGVVNVITQGGGVANLAVIPAAMFKSLVKNSKEQAPAFLTLDCGALTEGEVAGKIIVRPDLTSTIAATQALVGNGAAGITGYELPGAPVRAEQLQVSIGNIDVGLFGYYAAIRSSANFFSLVKYTAA